MSAVTHRLSSSQAWAARLPAGVESGLSGAALALLLLPAMPGVLAPLPLAVLHTLLAQLASLGGVSLLTLLVTFTASVLAGLGGRTRGAAALILLAIWSAGLLWARLGTHAAPGASRTAVLVLGGHRPPRQSSGADPGGTGRLPRGCTRVGTEFPAQG